MACKAWHQRAEALPVAAVSGTQGVGQRCVGMWLTLNVHALAVARVHRGKRLLPFFGEQEPPRDRWHLYIALYLTHTAGAMTVATGCGLAVDYRTVGPLTYQRGTVGKLAVFINAFASCHQCGGRGCVYCSGKQQHQQDLSPQQFAHIHTKTIF
jgi:hypothetical protein